MDLTLTLPSLITLIVGGVATVSWLIRLEALTRSSASKAAELAGKCDALHAMVSLNKEQAHLAQLDASERFITQGAFSELKRDLLAEIGRMEGRLEAQIDRIAPNPRRGSPRSGGQG